MLARRAHEEGAPFPEPRRRLLPDVLTALAESPALCPLAAAPEGTTVHYYRTAAGTEIDLLLEPPRGGHWAVEVKRSTAPAARGFHDVCCSRDGLTG